MEHAKVFTSKIRRKHSVCKELHSLLHVTPAVPKTTNQPNDTICTFKPLTDKLYIPKKKSQLKVKTVREIRREYEKYVYSYLPDEIEKQQQLLLRKIRYGSLRNESIKEIAKKMLNSDDPISRSAWQMLTNVNPEGHAYAKQFVKWDGKKILINGSRGGKSRFISNYNSSNDKTTGNSQNPKNNSVYTKRSLLRDSLLIRFRPGPLSKKKYLDNSYQKYHIGTADVINLPKVGLEVQPTLGLPISPSVTTVLNKIREMDGTISEKWAELSVSVLGSIRNNKPVQMNMDNCITLDLNYNKNYKKILMRQNSNELSDKQSFHTEVISKRQDLDDECVIKAVMNDMLSCVEISLKQDDMFTGEDEPRKTDNIQISAHGTQTKEKLKKKHGGELNRLDVRIIRLNDSEQNAPQCPYNFCQLGCVCSSIDCSYKLKGHCGRLDCMFECTCDFSDYKAVDLYESDCSEFVPGLLNLDNELNLTLSKEEMKFHQTIIMTDDKRILFKKQKRNWKTPRKYADFYRKMSLKTDLKTDKHLLLAIPKLNIKNTEPWCMVHNLYKCFCKLKYTTSSYQNIEFNNKNETGLNKGNNKAIINEAKPMEISTEPVSILENFTNSPLSTSSCARIRLYESNHSSEYYQKTHKKISEMEKNDTKLHSKLLSRIYKDNDDNHNQYCIFGEEIEFQNQIPVNVLEDKLDSAEASDKSPSLDEFVNNACVKSTTNLLTPELSNMLTTRSKTSLFSSEFTTRTFFNMVSSQKGRTGLVDKSKLISWLELNYKQYKKRSNDDVTNIRLEAPKKGKVAMYPWECILSRYRERKNHFLVVKEHPHRIFLTIDTNKEMFKNCVNIDSIRFDDLHKYPNTIKYLLTNASDLKDSFCILYGLSQCWELFGSIRKVKDSEPSSDDSCDNSSLHLEFPTECTGQNTERDIPVNESDEYIISDRNCKVLVESGDSHETLKTRFRKRKFETNKGDNEETVMESSEKRTLSKKRTFAALSKQSNKILLENENKLQNVINSDTEIASEKQVSDEVSKWFLMIVENDFHELQFSRRGFFVKYDKVIHSIKLSRLSGKVVRLSAQTNVDDLKNVQFGIYGIPNNTSELCVFIGPYEKNDSLGIETVKKQQTTTRRHTRGLWITIDSTKNEEIIQDPLSFVPPQFVQRKDMVSVVSTISEHNATTNDVTENTSNVIKQGSPKLVKPIKIRKTNQIYYIAPDGMIKELPKNPTSIQIQSPPKLVLVPSPAVNNPPKMTSTSTEHASMPSVIEVTPPLKRAGLSSGQKPVAEVAPQVNTTLNTLQNDSSNKPSLSLKGMCILKPEEINQRAVEQNIVSKLGTLSTRGNNNDIENFLANTTPCTIVDDVCVISDDDDENDYDNDLSKEVWIECQNVEQLGWISGRIKKDNSLSFQFPGFNFSDFYEQDKALKKISQVLCRKVLIPEISTINWKVVHSQDDLKATHKLTSSGLKHFSELSTVNPKVISLKISRKVCFRMKFHRVDLKVGNILFKGVASFYVRDNDTVKKRIQTNLEATIKCTAALKEIVLPKVRDFNKRVIIYETVVRPLLLYGRDAWTITQTVKDELTRMEKDVLKTFLNTNLTCKSLSDYEVQKYIPKTSIVDLIDEKSSLNTSSIDSDTSEELLRDNIADCEVPGQQKQKRCKQLVDMWQKGKAFSPSLTSKTNKLSDSILGYFDGKVSDEVRTELGDSLANMYKPDDSVD